MTASPGSVGDSERLAVLDRHGILDTEPEGRFDDIVRLATRLCAAPVALVSLVASDRQWFKARVGFPLCETDLDSSVCRFVLDEPDLLVIPDLTADARTTANPLVTGEPFIRFYAGAPLRADGQVLGSLCVIDTVPRPGGLTPEQADDLRALARQVGDLLELRRTLADRHDLLAARERTEARLHLALEATRIGIFDYDLVTGALTWDGRTREMFGVGPDGIVSYDRAFLPALHPEDRWVADAAVQAALDPAGSGLFDIEYRVRPLDGGPEAWVAARGQSVVENGRTVRFVGTVRDVTIRRRAEDALRATEERYRLAGRATNDAIWDWDLAADNVRWNEALTTAFGHAPETVEPTGAWWMAHIHPDDRRRIRDGIHAVVDGTGTAWSDEYRFLRADGSFADVIDRGFVIRDPSRRAIRMIGAMLDITERKATDARKAALVELGDRLRVATERVEVVGIAGEILARNLRVARAGYARVDIGRDLIEIERDWTRPGVASLAGSFPASRLGATIGRLRDGETLAMRDVATTDWLDPDRDTYNTTGIRSQIKVPLVDRGLLVGLLYAHSGEPRDWTPKEIAFARDLADRTFAALARLQAEAEQRVLNEELSHRLKNTLAMVLSIASQTLRTVSDRAPIEAFEQRVHALSSAHDVLLRRSWAAAPARDVARAALAGAGHGDRVDVSGPDLPLGPRATLSLSLLLHELATNAAKYGSLSVPTGRVRVDWRLDGEGEGRELTLDWTEHGGPPPSPPNGHGRKGFGSRLIRMGLAGTGGVELRYPPTGFQATMRAPLDQLQRS